MLQVVAVGGSLGDAFDIGVDDLLVALQREDQGDVDGDALGEGGGDGRQAFQGRRDLDHRVRAVDLLPQLDGLLLGVLGVVGQTRVDLDGDTAVDEVGGLGDLAEDVGGVAHIGGGELAHGGLDVDLAEFLELGVVRADLAQGLLEDGRVGGHTDDVLVLDELLEGAGLDTGAGQVVQPDRDAVVGRALSCFSHIVFSFDSVMEQIFKAPLLRGACRPCRPGGSRPLRIRLGGRLPMDHLAASASAMDALAASTTCSAVMPRSIMFCAPSPCRPNCSMETGLP